MARYNGATWPAPLVALALGLVVLALALLGRGGRSIPLLLAAAWAWTAMAFHYGTFAALNFMAPTYAVAFLVEAAVLAWLAARGGLRAAAPRGTRPWAGAALAAIALLGWPLLALTTPFGLAAAEVAGVAPDPTALFTLGILLLAAPPGRAVVAAAVIPLLWTLAGGATAWVVGNTAATVQAVLGIAAFGLLLAAARPPGR